MAYGRRLCRSVLNNFYVDDCLKSVPTEENAIQLSHDLCQLLSREGLRLTKWISNSRKTLLAIPESERAKEMKDFDFLKDNLQLKDLLVCTGTLKRIPLLSIYQCQINLLLVEVCCQQFHQFMIHWVWPFRLCLPQRLYCKT